MKFTYRCDQHGPFELDAPVGHAPLHAECPELGWLCEMAPRDFATDAASQTITTGDPFRAFHLSSKKQHAAAEQGREIGGPQDHFERKVLERERGITFVGDDTSGFTAGALRGIEREKDRAK